MPESVPLSAPAPPVVAQEFRSARWGCRIDAFAVIMLLALALLAGSFAARNSDLWLHLATGRLIATGGYHFGSDPFAYTTAGKYWANHSWLFDLGMYLAFNWFGGAGLVAIKAFAAATTAGTMLVAARGRGPVWVAVACIMLAVLAMTPRLLLQPTVASFLLLAVCLCCLRAGGRAFRAVPIIIAVWVNLDGWFILGPILVALFWLGRRIDPGREHQCSWPTWLIPASLIACLLSPHHAFALRLPLELSPWVWTSAFPNDPRFANVFYSPWRFGQLGEAGGYNLAAWAFFLLFSLGMLSFVLNRRSIVSWRFTVWVPFALLAAWQARLIPFFAVVAGPIAALNLREAMTERVFTRLGRSVVVAASIVLLGLGWLGLTNGFYNRDRGATWAVHTDPTLARAATGIAAWRQANHLDPEVRVFATNSDLGNYVAWFAPGERSFLDSRLHLFAEVSADFTALSQFSGTDTTIVKELLTKYQIACVVLHDPDYGRMTTGLRESADDGGLWEVARVEGGAVLLIPKGSPHSANRFDAESAAFGSTSTLPVAGDGPAALVEPDPWRWTTRGLGRKGSWEADAATVYLRFFENRAPKSPALPLLAIRAGRVGTEADVADPIAWLALGRGYSLLGERTWERESAAEFALLEYIRTAQVTTSLVQASLLNPNSIPTRESLARIFLRRKMYDLALVQLAEALRLSRRAGPLAGENTEAFADRVARLEAVVEPLEAAFQDAENRFLIRTAELAGDPFARARIAIELGLTQRAIDILVKSHPDLYGVAGLGLLADLLLQSGKAAECRILLDRAELRRNTAVLGFHTLPRNVERDGYRWPYRLPLYDWLDLCQCAAVGRYSGAAKIIDQLCMRLEADELAQTPVIAKNGHVLVAIEAGLAAPPIPMLVRLSSVRDHIRVTEYIAQIKSMSVIRADLMTLAGILELERGNARGATGRFESALSLYSGTKLLGLSAPGAALALRYNEAIRGH